MTLPYNITLFINSLSLTTAIMILFSHHSRKNFRFQILYTVICFSLIYILNRFANQEIAFLTIIFVAILLVLLYLTENVSGYKAIFYSLLTVNLVTAITITISSILQLFNLYTPHISHWLDIIIAVLLVLCSIATDNLLRQIVASKKIRSKLITRLLNLIMALFLVYCTVIYPKSIRFFSNVSFSVNYLALVLFVPMIGLIVIYLIQIETSKVYREMEQRLLHLIYDEIDSKNTFVLKTLHYFTSLMRMINYYLETGNYKELGAFMNEKLEPEYRHIINMTDSFENNIKKLDAIESTLIKGQIITYLHDLEQLSNISCYVRISKPVIDLRIDEIELFKLLNIFLDNAMNELKSIEVDERVKLQAKLIIAFRDCEGRLEIQIINTLNDVPAASAYDKKGQVGIGLTYAKEIIGKQAIEYSSSVEQRGYCNMYVVNLII